LPRRLNQESLKTKTNSPMLRFDEGLTLLLSAPLDAAIHSRLGH